MENIKKEFKAILTEIKNSFAVSPLISEKTKIVFILESPHVEELKQGTPVAGSAGKHMSAVLLKQKKAFGLYIREQEADFPIGVMNICSIPMQKSAYTSELGLELVSKYVLFFDTLEFVRTHNQTKYISLEAVAMQEIILEEIENQLEFLKKNDVIMIPCGKFAEKFIALLKEKPLTWEVKVGIPHPSRGLWRWGKYQSQIQSLKSLYSWEV